MTNCGWITMMVWCYTQLICHICGSRQVTWPLCVQRFGFFIISVFRHYRIEVSIITVHHTIWSQNCKIWSDAEDGWRRVVIKFIHRYSSIGPVLGSSSFHYEKACRGSHIVSKRKANNMFGLIEEKLRNCPTIGSLGWKLIKTFIYKLTGKWRQKSLTCLTLWRRTMRGVALSFLQ